MSKMRSAKFSTADGQKRLMALSMDQDESHWIARPVSTKPTGDYGCDPVGDGTFRMVPSGDVVDYAERCKRLHRS